MNVIMKSKKNHYFITPTLSQDYTAELLTDYFNGEKFHRGFVVEYLTSQIIKPPSLALTTLIKCKRSIQNIHLVMSHTDLNKWTQAYEEAQRKRETLEGYL